MLATAQSPMRDAKAVLAQSGRPRYPALGSSSAKAYSVFCGNRASG